MRSYETTFIVDPVLSEGEIKQTADMYLKHLKNEGCEIVHINELGLRQLAYPIKRRNSGVYYNVELTAPNGEFIEKIELAFRRDEHIMRFLTIRLDKYAIQYNQDKRDGKIGAHKRKMQAEAKVKAEKEEAENRAKKEAKAKKDAARKEAAVKKAAAKKAAAAVAAENEPSSDNTEKTES